MSSMEVDPPINMNTPLTRIINPNPNAQQTLNNTLDIQMDPLANPPNIVVDHIGDITLEPSVGSHTIINTNAPQVVDLSPLNPKVARSKKSTKDDLDSNHAPIGQCLWCPRPPNTQSSNGVKISHYGNSMNHLSSPIENSSTCRITQRKRPIVQITIVFIGEHNYESPHR